MPLGHSGLWPPEHTLLELLKDIEHQLDECPEEIDRHRAQEHIDGLRDLIQALPTRRAMRRENEGKG